MHELHEYIKDYDQYVMLQVHVIKQVKPTIQMQLDYAMNILGEALDA